MAENEDFFTDDDLDTLPTNALDALEQRAITSSTQQLETDVPSNKAQPALHGKARNPFAKSNNGVLSLQLKHAPNGAGYSSPSDLPAALARAPNAPSSDYGFDDEDVIDLDAPPMIIEPAQTRQSRQSAFPTRRYGVKQPLDPETAAAFAEADAELGNTLHGDWLGNHASWQDQAESSMDISLLRARIAELETEQAKLRQSAQDARNEVRVKQGEIAIVRGAQDKISKQYEARIAVMQRLHADEAARQKAELEAQRKEREKMRTDNRFLQHDLAQESERVKRLNAPSRGKSVSNHVQRGTPEKSRRAAQGDGFDDNEVYMHSPSRSKEKTRDNPTPRLGAKRKRPVCDSPSTSLSFDQTLLPVRQEIPEQSAAASSKSPSKAARLRDESNYEVMQLVLNHRPVEGHERTIEALMKHTFPSRPHQTVSSLFLDGISRQTHSATESFPISVSRVLLRLWMRLLEEKLYAPYWLILDMLGFVLQSELSVSKSVLVEDIVPLCTRTVELVATTLARASTDRTFAAKMDRQALERLAADVDVEETLDFLHDICQAASLVPERNEVFWRTIDSHFLFVMLSKAQPLEQSMIMLRMIETSARQTSLGVLWEDPEQQIQHERQLMDRLTNLLFESPEQAEDEPPYTDDEILELRIAVLQIFRVMCHNEHGTQLLAQHRSAIGRLVRFLYAQVTKLYSVRPSAGFSRTDIGDALQQQPYELVADTVNRTTRLLHHLFRSFDDPSRALQKVHAVHGGYHKFLISFTRIAFTEQVVFEAGIDDAAAEAAHNILDNVLGPEDGEAVMQAFETPKASKGPAMPKNAGGQPSQRSDMTMNKPD